MSAPKTILLILASLMAYVLSAQTERQMAAIAFLCGAEGAESLGEEEIEKYSALLSRPLEINLAGHSRLSASGILTPYQVASLEDYIKNHGAVMSYTELSMLDGFGEAFVTALAPFISLRSAPGTIAGMPNGPSGLRQDIVTRVSWKDGAYAYGAKYKIALGESVEASATWRETYSGKWPEYSFNVVYYGKKRPFKVMAGDFAGRFGQGLAMWTGFSLGGFSSSASFIRKGTGLAPSWSYSGDASHRGVSADCSFGRVTVSAMVTFPGLRKKWESGKATDVTSLPALNASWFGKNGQAGVTLAGNGKASADFRWTVKGADLFGEAAYDFPGRAAAVVTGAIIPLREEWKISAAARCYQAGFNPDNTGAIRSWSKVSDELALSSGLEWKASVFTVDVVRKLSEDKAQLKLFLKVPLRLSDCLTLEVRGNERLRPYDEFRHRTGMRCEANFSSSGLSVIYGPSDGPSWMCRARVEGVLCESYGLLAYLEGGRKTERFSAYLRGTYFDAERWNDRVYSYERDAPGNFSVPAYYGKGFSVVFTAGSKFSFRFGRRYGSLRLYAKMALVEYFKDKPDKVEFKLQAAFGV